MKKAIKDHLRDFLAVLGLVVVALSVTYVVVQQQRLRIPLLEERPFELKAEMDTAQAISPGQGQTVRVAGVRIGDISDVQYEDGNAVVTMDIDRKFLPVYKDATILLRPKTGLKDMFLELDPGTRAAGEYDEGGTIPVANTAPDVNLDEVLALLDTDTRAYLRLLLTGAGEGLHGRAKDLGKLFGSLGPINRDLARLNTKVATRKDELARTIHNMNLLFDRVGNEDVEIASLIDSSNSALGAIGEQDPDVQRATRLLGPTLRQTRIALGETDKLAVLLGPTLNRLRPFARQLKPVNESLLALARASTNDVKTRIRPFVRSARKPVRSLRPAAQRLSRATPRLTVLAKKINKLGNMAAYNPNGAEACPALPCAAGRDEGYLYWAAWLAHNGDSVFQNQDAHGVARRIYLTAPCSDLAALVSFSPLAGIITPFQPVLDSGVCPP